MEAALGIEPRYRGFADLCLTAWLCRLKYYGLIIHYNTFLSFFK